MPSRPSVAGWMRLKVVCQSPRSGLLDTLLFHASDVLTCVRCLSYCAMIVAAPQAGKWCSSCMAFSA